jgi:D-alanine-D-alanine ligase
MFNTTNKILAKELFRAKGIPTADWFTLDQIDLLDPETKYILKPAWEDGSLGIDEHSVFMGNDVAYKEKTRAFQPNRFFIEKLIEGREFNITVLGGNKGPEVMPLAEMQFFDYPEDKPKILGYTAKWNTDSFEYEHTSRTFDYEDKDRPLLQKLEAVALKCWRDFNICGYIRVDLRLDLNDNPNVLEINANPCLSENGGFYAACAQKGLTFRDIVERIVEDAYK